MWWCGRLHLVRLALLRPALWANRIKPRPNCNLALRKACGPSGEDPGPGQAGGPSMSAGEGQDLRQSLVAMQNSLTQIDGMIDSLSYRMDRMSERLDKHAERLDQAERRISEVEDGQMELNTGHTKLNKMQEARRQFIAGKKQLRDLQLEYCMLYPAKLRVEVEGKPLFFTDHKKLALFIKHRTARNVDCSRDDTDSRAAED
ncbi:hypothetical protein NDU88_002175 [Pleurodeles waltl]|uniref:Uncharacterized protein n=1 Tax=Pleurodeles waltl TaxID=8319 RepID=A0AAV7L0I8_PLEWA|nr:hypothetical protein NDU88_002175 [Pleurodeles waltl]